MTNHELTARQRQVLECIEASMRDRGYPPSVREIGDAVGLASPSSVHAQLSTLQKLGYLRRDATKPRAIEVRYDPLSGATVERRPVRHIPLVGDVAAGTDVLAQENVEEVLPVASDLTGDGDLFMLRVRGESMIDAGDTVMDAIGSDIAKPDVRELSYDATPLKPLASMFAAADDLATAIAAITCPVLVCNSPQDHVVPITDSDYIAEHVQGPVERVTLENSYHVATLDHDAELIETTAVDFARRVTHQG